MPPIGPLHDLVWAVVPAGKVHVPIYLLPVVGWLWWEIAQYRKNR